MAKKIVPPTDVPVVEVGGELQPGDEGYSVPLDDDAENWMAEHRLEQLRARGWTGSVAEYIEEWERLDADPLGQTAPMTDLERAQQINNREPRPASWAEELERGREIVRKVGDLPESIAYEMLMRAQGAGDNPLAEIMALRPPGAPNYPPTGRI